MKVNQLFVENASQRAAINQLEKEYKEKGYSTSKEVMLGDLRIDLIAEKENEKVIVEIISRAASEERNEEYWKKYIELLKSHGNYSLRLVVANPIVRKEIEFDGLENLLMDELSVIPDEIDQLSTHSTIESVSDISIDKILINEDEIHINGDCWITVELQYGSNSDSENDDGLNFSDNYQLFFELIVKQDEECKYYIDSKQRFEVDIDKFYK
jgi:hypothetical protein